MLKSGAVVSLGEGVGYLASFARNMILARLLSKADFGIAAVFAMVMSLLEFTAKLSVGRFLIRDPEGDDPVFVNTGHTLQALAAGVSAVLIVLASPVLAAWFGVADHSWALMVLGGVVLVRGLQHLDTQRFQRHLRFGPAAAVEAIPQVIVTLAACPVAMWLGDYRAVLVLLVLKALMSLALSHLVAELPYRWVWHPEFGRRMLRFGWPLLLTGFLMFGIMQGDQFLVASFYDMAQLAPYAAAATLVMAPQFLYSRVFNAVALPLVSRVQEIPAVFIRRYRQVLAGMLLYASASTAAFIVGCEALMRAVYGAKYSGAGPIVGWLAAVAAYRGLRVSVAVANIAKGDSDSQLIANLWRATSLAPAFIVAWLGQPLWMIAACGILGELLATIVCVWRLKNRAGVPMSLTLWPAAGIGLISCGAGLLAHWTATVPVWAGLLAALGAGSAAAGITVALVPELRSEARLVMRELRFRGPTGAFIKWMGHGQGNGVSPAPER